MTDKLWIVYDERAWLGTEAATVLESCNSERDAVKRSDFEGVVYRYDVDTDGTTLINETLIGPTRLLARRSR